MAFETYLGAFELAMARLVTAFGQWPDVYLSQSDLHAALCAYLYEGDLFKGLHTTRDGRRTPLVHQQYPTTSHNGWFGDGIAGMDRFDVVLLNPSFVRASGLDTVARNARDRGAGTANKGERLMPLLAAANLVIADRFGASMMKLVERRFFSLVNAEQNAERAYLGVFLRQWELDDEAQRGFEAIVSWADQHSFVRVCCVQSYRDGAGHVFAGRYLNDWRQEAPLLPMEPSAPRHTGPVVAMP